MVNASQLARAGYTYLGRLYTEMDCQAFVERCLLDCGLKINLSGSNAWYRKMDWVGTPEECKKQFGTIPPGAFLFILEQGGKEPEKYKSDQIGNASHIGIYTGTRTGAIHSSASKGCVVESRFTGKSISGGWNRVGLWGKVLYDVAINSQLAGGKAMYEAVVTGGGLNMRQAQDTKSKRIAQVPDGETVNVVNEAGNWSKIEYDGRSGWVQNKFLMKKTTNEDSDFLLSIYNAIGAIYDQLGDKLGKRG